MSSFPNSEKPLPAKSVEEVTGENVRTIAQLERAAQQAESRGDRIAAVINRTCGSMTFLAINAIAFGAWMTLNTVVLAKPWDPFPFAFLTLAVSLEAIFLSIFLLIAGNRQGRIDERRSHLDLQINLLAEQENTETMKLLHLIARTVGAKVPNKEYGMLTQTTDPEKLIAQIDSIAQGIEVSSGEKVDASTDADRDSP